VRPDSFIEHLLKQYRCPAFIDEVGMGALFAELVACAVMIPKPFEAPEVDDSKKLKHDLIYELAPKLRKKVVYAFGVVTCPELKTIRNMMKADRLAMKRAVEALPVVPDALFIDGIFPIGGLTAPVYTVIKGDAKVFGIAVASIIAKDYRDHMVVTRYGHKYPKYHITSNKGYRSPDHLMAIRRWGLTPYHREWMPQIKRVLSGDYDHVIHTKYQDQWNNITKKEV